jgi:hypothetical protein
MNQNIKIKLGLNTPAAEENQNIKIMASTALQEAKHRVASPYTMYAKT